MPRVRLSAGQLRTPRNPRGYHGYDSSYGYGVYGYDQGHGGYEPDYAEAPGNRYRLGPGLAYPSIYTDLPDTPTSALMETLVNIRQQVVLGGFADAVQSVAGFASLHCGITMLVALMVQFTINIRWLKIAVWVNFGITAVATLYFGWHYIADDVAGILIALVSFYVGGLAKIGRAHV